MMSTSEADSQKILEEEILQDANRSAERALKRAKREAEQIRAKADEQAQEERERILAQGRERASVERSMILAAVPLRATRHRLERQEELVRQVMADALRRLEGMDAETSLRALAGLAAAALGAMPGDDFRVLVSTRGPAVDADRLRHEIVREARERLGRRVRMTCEPSDDLAPGFLLQTADGRLVWDNTLAERMRRLQPLLRREMAPLLFGEAQTNPRDHDTAAEKH